MIYNSLSFIEGKEVGRRGPKRKLEVSELTGVLGEIKEGGMTLATLS